VLCPAHALIEPVKRSKVQQANSDLFCPGVLGWAALCFCCGPHSGKFQATGPVSRPRRARKLTESSAASKFEPMRPNADRTNPARALEQSPRTFRRVQERPSKLKPDPAHVPSPFLRPLHLENFPVPQRARTMSGVGLGRSQRPSSNATRPDGYGAGGPPASAASGKGVRRNNLSYRAGQAYVSYVIRQTFWLDLTINQSAPSSESCCLHDRRLLSQTCRETPGPASTT